MASEYANMGLFLEDDQELLKILKDHQCLVKGKAILAVTEITAFRVLAILKDKGYRFFNPSLLARSWDVSRQALNNVINRGLLVTIEYQGGFFEYKYVVLEPVEKTVERSNREKEKPDAAGWVQPSIPLEDVAPIAAVESFEGLSGKEIQERDSICAEWRGCEFRGTCFDQVINWDCICQKEDGALPIPASAPQGEELLEAMTFKTEAEPVELAELYREFPDARPTVAELAAKGFRENEIKILRGGFSLVRWDRSTKRLVRTFRDGRGGWELEGDFETYAAGERKLANLLEAADVVEIGIGGRTINSKDEKKLRDAGFTFYRNAGMDYGEKWGRIKIGPSWSTFKRCDSKEELAAAWSELMKGEKALEG